MLTMMNEKLKPNGLEMPKGNLNGKNLTDLDMNLSLSSAATMSANGFTKSAPESMIASFGNTTTNNGTENLNGMTSESNRAELQEKLGFGANLLSTEQMMSVTMAQQRLENEARMASQLCYNRCVQANFDPVMSRVQAETVYRNKMLQGQNAITAELSTLYQTQIQQLLLKIAPSKQNKNKEDSESKENENKTTELLTATEISKSASSMEDRIKKESKIQKNDSKSANVKKAGPGRPRKNPNTEKGEKAKVTVSNKSKSWSASSLVGNRVQIEWEKTWYPALVQSYDDKTQICNVLYDNGSPETCIFHSSGKATSPDGEDEFKWKKCTNKNVNKRNITVATGGDENADKNAVNAKNSVQSKNTKRNKLTPKSV